VLGEIRGGGPVWDVESGGTVCVPVADCQRPQSTARLKPETMIVTFEEFSPTHDLFDYKPKNPKSCSELYATLRESVWVHCYLACGHMITVHPEDLKESSSPSMIECWECEEESKGASKKRFPPTE
jgi:hypothetical protein